MKDSRRAALVLVLAMHVSLSLGPLFRVAGAGGGAVLFSWGLGVRF